MIIDGVTQYQLDWHTSDLPDCAGLAALNEWRTRFFDLGVIGQCEARYGGVGFGNVSCRLNDREFIVSGTQTGHLRVLTPAHYCRVLGCDPQRNQVRAAGPVAPSSEAMTHHMIYQCVPTALFVVHIHAPHLWLAAASLGIPVTPPTVGYGTPAMTAAVADIINAGPVDMIAMGGHEDGVIAWSDTLAHLGPRLCEALDAASKR